jgi:hypothetical protein
MTYYECIVVFKEASSLYNKQKIRLKIEIKNKSESV